MKDGEKRQETSCKIEEPGPYSSNILQPIWFRRFVRNFDEMDRIIHGSRHNFLLHIGILFWVVVLLTSKVQR